MWEPPEYPGPCFDLHFNRFDGFIFEAEKPFENVCAAGASPVLRLSGPAGGFRIIAIRVLLVETARLLGLTFFCGWGSTQ